jgi:hypothetical protein
MRTRTVEPIRLGEPSSPKARRSSSAVAEKPTVRRSVSGWRRRPLRCTSSTTGAVVSRTVNSPCTRAWRSSIGSIRVERKVIVGNSSARNQRRPSIVRFQSASPKSRRSTASSIVASAPSQPSGS